MKLKTTILLFFISISVYSQWQNLTLNHTSGVRQYWLYVPTNYNAANPTSLVLTLHGLGDTSDNFRGIGFNQLAEANNIIVVCPQAKTDPVAGTAWNSGAGPSYYNPNGNVDDVGFISSLIDVVSAQYAVNPNKVFACGFSMGGFMTERLALQLNNKIKAFASVAGTFGNHIMPVAPGAAGSPIRIAHFHGTSDGTISYTGNSYGMDVDPMINYWKTNNQSNSVGVQTALPNTQNDGFTVDHFKYTSPNNNSVIELYRVNGAGHIWLTSANDISYTVKIWEFFNDYIQTVLAVSDFENKESELIVYQNPLENVLHFSINGDNQNEIFNLEIFDLLGKKMFSKNIQFLNGNFQLNTDTLSLNSGIYLVKLKCNSEEFIKKIIIQ